MTLRPRSLGGRLGLLLVGVLLIAQMFSAALHFRDRGEVLKHVAGYNSAQRIAGIVRLLDGLPPAQRELAATQLDLPDLRLHLSDVPQQLPGDSADSARARLFHQLLHFQLGADRTIRLYMPNSPLAAQPGFAVDPGPQRWMPPPMRHMLAQQGDIPIGGYSFIVQVQLQDRQWISFAYHLPDELAGWPWDLLIGLLILFTAVLLVSFFAVRWLTRPLSELAEAADRLGRDIDQPPLAEEGPTEVRRAARAFNTMQTRLARFVEERTRILAAVSHDLKTPITRMRLRTGKIADPQLHDKFDNDLQDMQQLVQSSLDFMRGIAPREQTRPLDIEALLESLADDARDQGHEVSIEGDPIAPYPGKPLALKRCFGNLLDNAVRYGGDVTLRVEDSPAALRVIVSDAGPGIAEHLLNKVFEPFFRAEPSRNRKTGGTGLGLSIARNIARAHGGELVLCNRAPHGLDAIVSLPRQAVVTNCYPRTSGSRNDTC